MRPTLADSWDGNSVSNLLLKPNLQMKVNIPNLAYLMQLVFVQNN